MATNETDDQALEAGHHASHIAATGSTATEESPQVGQLIDGCRIDLPRDDVVEEIEFERFFRLNLTFGMLHGSPNPGGPLNQNLPRLAMARPPDGDDPPIGDEPPHPPIDEPPPIEPPDDQDPDAPPEPLPIIDSIDVGSLPLALYMPFTQQWKLDGYNRGRVVNSFTLSPGEEQTVELFTWDRLRSAFESSMSFDSDESTESSGSRRDVTDVSNDVSKQTGLEMTTGGKVGFKVGVVNVDLNAGMDAKTGVNDAEKSTRSTIVEATTRSTNHVRTSRTLKVTESRESGREERVTRKLRNPNACHTLTIPFFEVLANYNVSTFVRPNDVRLVVLIGSSGVTQLQVITRDTIREHETSLRLALLDGALAPGFEAARLLDSRDRACGVLCTGCTCGDEESGETDSKEWDAVQSAAIKVMTAVQLLRTTRVFFPLSVIWATPAYLGGAGATPGLVNSGITDIKRHLFQAALADGAPRLLGDLAGTGIVSTAATISASQATSMAAVLAALPPTALGILHADPGLSDRVGWEIYGAVLVFHPEFISAGVIAATVRSSAGGLTSYDDQGLLGAIGEFQTAYAAWVKAQEEARKDADTRAALERIANEERSVRILESYGLRETADAQERLDALLKHLNDPANRDHYRFAVWNERAGSADDMIMALALAGLVEPTPVGMVNDTLAVPIRLDHEPRVAKFFAESISDLVDHTVVDEARHILPTAALYAEAIVGQCCACESIYVEMQNRGAETVRLQNDLLEVERDRLRARLGANPPLLDKDPADVDLHKGGCGCGCGCAGGCGGDCAGCHGSPASGNEHDQPGGGPADPPDTDPTPDTDTDTPTPDD